MNQRIVIRKKKNFDEESARQLNQFKQQSIKVKHFIISYIYDVFNIEKSDFQTAVQQVFSNPVTDEVALNYIPAEKHFAVECLPGNYDQRADSAEQCLTLLGIENVRVQSAILYEFDDISEEEEQNLKSLLINPIESREKDLSQLKLPEIPGVKPVPIVEKFLTKSKKELTELHDQFGFSFELDDLIFIQDYFKTIHRDPTETELKMLDTYWSDHCRHTTFETEITDIEIKSKFKKTIRRTLNNYLKLRKELNIKKPVRLMDLATIMGKYFVKTGTIDNIEISEEVNACSIEIEVEENGETGKWLLMFKNETHNHPTEVEPYGGASTCIGGAIRDPLSGRAFVYQAMRITGSANPLEKREDTLKGKLPQRKITTEAAKGYSAYGNQIGLATTYVKEIYHEGYKAKRMEVGFVAGAVKKDWVRRDTPKAGDKIILLGGKTGRDGIGGATGSSKTHDGQNRLSLSAEVQKGNAPVERKIQRLFKREEVVRMIKKCNDFGAGGTSVAIGEISDGVRINLDAIPTKYKGLNGTELAISESQERIAVVLEEKDVSRFISFSAEENLEAIEVAEVTDDERIKMFWRGKKIVDLERSFVNTHGVRKQTKVIIADTNNKPSPFENRPFTKKHFFDLLKELNHCSQKGLVEMFDSSVGRSTVLAPFGGKNSMTPEEVSVQKIPTPGFTNTVSIASFGFNPSISEWSCYHGGYYAVIESVAKIVAAGGDYREIRLTFQEYFEQLRKKPERWGKPFAALLGTIQAQKELGIAAIGGKDSMSGTYQDINVPPTLISFAVCPNDARQIISSTLEKKPAFLYAFLPPSVEDNILDAETLKTFYKCVRQELNSKIIAMKAITFGGIAETITLMALGNEVGVELKPKAPLMQYFPGGLIFQVDRKIEKIAAINANVQLIGYTNESAEIKMQQESFSIKNIKDTWQKTLSSIFPHESKYITPIIIQNQTDIPKKEESPKLQAIKRKPKVLIPVFPGTNSEYDTQKAFEKEGAQVRQVVFRNLKPAWIKSSVNEWSMAIDEADIICFPGGFSAADEPEGSGKYMAAALRNPIIKTAIHRFLDHDGLILGICNGFQALIKSGLLPYGRISDINEHSPTLYYNDIGRHVAQFVRTKVTRTTSPWLEGMQGKIYQVPVSHGEGKFIASPALIKELSEKQQIATQYVDEKGNPSMEMPHNPNGSFYAVEGITSPCGRIYGRMAHPERVEKGTFKNIPELEVMNIFRNGVNYILRKQSRLQK